MKASLIGDFPRCNSEVTENGEENKLRNNNHV